MAKRLFEILDTLNVEDTNNGTHFVAVSNALVAGQLVKAGGHITMGVDNDTFRKVTRDKLIPILVCVDLEQYNKLKD